MKRRELVKLMSLATGAALSIPLSNTLLIACKEVNKEKEADYVLHFFDDEAFSFIKNLLEIVLPKTDSPSAIDVGVHQIMDTIIGTVYNPEQQENFSEKFNALKNFVGNEAEAEKLEILLKSDKEKNKLAKAGLLDIKQQAVAYYLSTKEIATNYLNYLPVPGVYKACVPLDSVNGKAWAI